MPIYYYTALKGPKKGIVDALDLEGAKEKLREQGIYVTKIWSGTGKSRRHSLKGQSLATFTAQLGQLIASGMPVFESLLALEEQYRGEKFHRVLATLCEQIKAGASLSAAMRQHPDSFNQLYCSMIAAGEASGSLDVVLQKLATLLAKQLKTRRQIITALTYPAVIASFCVVVVFLLLTFAIPSMEALLSDRALNKFTACVLLCSHFLTRYWLLYLPAAAGFLFGITLFFRNVKRRSKLALKLPIIRKLAAQAALSRFCRTLASLQEGGVSLIDALRLARKVMMNPTLEEVIERAEKRIVEGSSLSQQLTNKKHIPPLIPRMLAVGEESGSMLPMLIQIADLYEEELEKSLTRATALVQPVILIVMGGIIGVIMLAILLPLTDVSSML